MNSSPAHALHVVIEKPLKRSPSRLQIDDNCYIATRRLESAFHVSSWKLQWGLSSCKDLKPGDFVVAKWFRKAELRHKFLHEEQFFHLNAAEKLLKFFEQHKLRKPDRDLDRFYPPEDPRRPTAKDFESWPAEQSTGVRRTLKRENEKARTEALVVTTLPHTERNWP